MAQHFHRAIQQIFILRRYPATMRCLNLFIFLIFAAPTALAAQAWPEGALPGWDDYVSGNFSAARSHARAARSAEGYALACRSGLVLGSYFETGNTAVRTLHQALEDCEASLALDPSHYVAGLSHAIALGFEGRRLRKVRYARASIREIRALIDRYPENGMALGALAGWNAEVAREGFFARLLLRASKKRAAALYEEALGLPNAGLPLAFEHVRFLAQGKKNERQQAAMKIRQTLAAKPQDAFEKLLQEKMQALLRALETSDKGALKVALTSATPFAGIEQWRDARAFPLRPEGQP